jgi:hypothetical protein
MMRRWDRIRRNKEKDQVSNFGKQNGENSVNRRRGRGIETAAMRAVGHQLRRQYVVAAEGGMADPDSVQLLGGSQWGCEADGVGSLSSWGGGRCRSGDACPCPLQSGRRANWSMSERGLRHQR